MSLLGSLAKKINLGFLLYLFISVWSFACYDGQSASLIVFTVFSLYHHVKQEAIVHIHFFLESIQQVCKFGGKTQKKLKGMVAFTQTILEPVLRLLLFFMLPKRMGLVFCLHAVP